MIPSQPRRRGRPPKFGKPSRLVAMTLPEDVLAGLHDVHPDPAWAVVRLFDGKRPPREGDTAAKPQLPAIVEVSKAHALILVDPHVVKNLPRVAAIPLDESRAFLAMEDGRGIADLELSVLDRLEHPDVQATERKALTELRERLKQWRTDPALRLESRTIIVAGRRTPSRTRRALSRTVGSVSASCVAPWLWDVLPELARLL